ncbi:MAG: MopE-related protein [Myxococcota bacterium]
MSVRLHRLSPTLIACPLMLGCSLAGLFDEPPPSECVPAEYFPDLDGDGFGGPEGVIACTPPERTVRESGDCNDLDSEIHPEANEVCDGIDNDCDGDQDDPEAAGLSCGTTGTTGGCYDGRCRCEPNLGDCNGDPADGCETDLRTSARHCGACGSNCGAAGSCNDGRCDEVLALGGGTYRSCAIRSQGVACWGRDDLPGLGGPQIDLLPRSVSEVHSVGSVQGFYSGEVYSCAIDALGAVQCWGSDWFGDLGPQRPNPEVPSPVVMDAVSVSTLLGGGCAVQSSGEVRCWGTNHRGQRGNGEAGAPAEATPVAIINDATQVGGAGRTAYDGATLAGTVRFCATRRDGSVACWGTPFDDDNQRPSPDDWPVPVDVGAYRDAHQVAVGFLHTCVLRRTGQIECWAPNEEGLLGAGDAGPLVSAAPVPVEGVTDAVSVHVGLRHSCALHEGGGVSCWGRNSRAQLGSGDLEDASAPRFVQVLPPAQDLFTGRDHACALTASGVYCWGINDVGQLGDGTTARRPAPVRVVGLSPSRELALGESHACTRRATGTVTCFGRSDEGQLGRSSSDNGRPARITLGNVAEVALAGAHSCARTANGEVWCWGDLPDNPSDTPRRVETLGQTVAKALSTTATRGSCVVNEMHQIVCWHRDHGERVGAFDDYVSVVGGAIRGCGLRRDGTVWCWSVSEDLIAGPVEVSEVVELVGDPAGHACARSRQGTVSCWGGNRYGQLGSLPAQNDGKQAFPVPGIRGAVELASGTSHTCARFRSGQVWCWGRNNFGQLGDGGTSDRHRPEPVSTIEDAAAVFAGGETTCVRHRSDRFSCWGRNDFGQLGDGTLETRLVPVPIIPP